MDRHIVKTVLILLFAGTFANAGESIVLDNQSFFFRSANDLGPSIVPAQRVERDSGLIQSLVVPADVPMNRQAVHEEPLRPESTGLGLAAYEPPTDRIPLSSDVERSATPGNLSAVSRIGKNALSLERPQAIETFVENRFMQLVGWEDGSNNRSFNADGGCNCGRIMDCSCGSGCQSVVGNNWQCNQNFCGNGCNGCNGGCNGCNGGCCNGCDRWGGNGLLGRKLLDGGFIGGLLDGCLSELDCGADCSCGDETCDLGCDERCHEIGGWLAWGTYWNSHGIDNSSGNAPLGFNNIAGPQLNQAWLYLTREAQTGGGLDWGYRIDGLWGADGPDTTSFGDGSWDSGWTTSGQYGFAIPQLYGEIAYNKTRVKLGHFYTIIGYEVVQAPDNFFYSRPYTMFYNEPFTHSGILMERSVCDTVTTYCGWTAGWDTGFSNGNNGSVYLGGLSWTPSDKLTTTYATTMGDPGDDPVLGSRTWMSSLVMDWTPNDRWEYVFQSDYQQRRSVALGGRSYGLNNYLFYKLGQRTRLGMRYEWFREGRGANGLAGASEHFHALTFGLNRKTRHGVTLRPEMRYDWVDRDDAFAGGPYANGTKRSQFTIGMSAVKTF